MRLMTKEELVAVGGGYETDGNGSSFTVQYYSHPKMVLGGIDGGMPEQTVVIDGTAARDALARNDALARFSCEIISTGVGLTAGTLSLPAGPAVAAIIGSGASWLTDKGCNMLIDEQIKNDRRKNNRELP